MKNVVKAALMLAALAGMSVGPAAAQDRRTDSRIESLERQIRELQAIVYEEGGDGGANVRFEGANPIPQIDRRPASAAPSGAESSVRLSQLEREVQNLTGRIEEIQYQLRQQQQQMQRLVEVVYPDDEGNLNMGLQGQRELLGPDGRMEEGEPLAPIDNGGPVDLVGGGSARAALPEFRDADTAYAAGRSALLEARYSDAERAFVVVTEDYPDNPRAGDAMYYLGETYLAQGDLGGAARVFLDFIRGYPESDRAPEAHLKLGQAFARADKSREACRVWQRALSSYDAMEPNLRDRITDMREASCQA
jgi:tol-pal system protein YbgF